MRGADSLAKNRFDDSLTEEARNRSPRRVHTTTSHKVAHPHHDLFNPTSTKGNNASLSVNGNNTSVNPLLGAGQSMRDGTSTTAASGKAAGKHGKRSKAKEEDTVAVVRVPSSRADHFPEEEEADITGTAVSTNRASSSSVSSSSSSSSTDWCGARAVRTKWRAHFLLLLLLSAILSLVFIIMDAVSLTRIRETRKLSSLGMEAAGEALATAAHCSGGSSNLTVFDPIPVPARLHSFRATMEGKEKRRKYRRAGDPAYVTYVDAAIQSLEHASCGDAVAHLNDLLTVLSLETQRAERRKSRSLSSDSSVSTLSDAWIVAMGQLQSESLLSASERAPVTARRALEGLSLNYLCESPTMASFAVNVTPQLKDALYCDNVSRQEWFHTVPVLQPPNIDIHAIFPLFTYLSHTWAERVPDLPTNIPDTHYYIHFAVHSVIVTVCVLGIYILLHVTLERRREELTESIVRRDFRLVPQNRRDDVVVAMTQNALRLMDYYCWRLGNLDPSAGGDMDPDGANAIHREEGRHLADDEGVPLALEGPNSKRSKAGVFKAKKHGGDDRDVSEGEDDTGSIGNPLRHHHHHHQSTMKDGPSPFGSPLEDGNLVLEGQRLSNPSSAGSGPLEVEGDTGAGDADRMRNLSVVERQRRAMRLGMVGLHNRLRRLGHAGVVPRDEAVRTSGSAEINFNEFLLSQAGVRVALLTEYGREYASLQDSTQIQIYLHQLVHPMLLLRPFVPPYMVRALRLAKEEYHNIGPSMERDGLGAGIVLREGLEDDCPEVLLPPLPQAEAPTKSGTAPAASGAAQNSLPAAAGASAGAKPPRSPSAATGEGAGTAPSKPRRTTAYLYVSFRTFNTWDALLRAEQHYAGDEAGTSGSGGRRHRVAGAASDSDGEEMMERLSDDARQRGAAMDALVTVADTDRASSPVRSSSPPRAIEGAKRGAHRGRGKRNRGALGGRLVDASPLRRGSASSVNPLTAVGGEGVERVGSPLHVADRPPQLHHHHPPHSAGRGPTTTTAYPLSVVAAGVNLMLYNIRTASEAFGGDVVQVSSDGVLVQFRPRSLVEAQQSHCFVLEEEEKRDTPDATSSGESGKHRSGADDDRHQARERQLAGMCVEERAARAALTIEGCVNRYLEACDHCLVPAELLQCSQFVLSDQSCAEWWLGVHGLSDGQGPAGSHDATLSKAVTSGLGPHRGSAGASSPYPGTVSGDHDVVSEPVITGSMRGLVEFHVTRHYCVLSRCMPLVFSLEQVAMERGSHGILITRAVYDRIGKHATARPVHYLDIPNLNLYYFKQRLVQDQGNAGSSSSSSGGGYPTRHMRSSNGGRAHGNSSSGSAPGGGSVDAAQAASLRRGDAKDPTEQYARPPSEATAASGGASAHEEDGEDSEEADVVEFPFCASGTLYELQSIAPMDVASFAYQTYAAQRDHTQARRDHWHLIWSRYEEILRARLTVRAMQSYLDRLFYGATMSSMPGAGSALRGGDGVSRRFAGSPPTGSVMAPTGGGRLGRNPNASVVMSQHMASSAANSTVGSGAGGPVGRGKNGGTNTGANGAEVVMLLFNEKECKQRGRTGTGRSPTTAAAGPSGDFLTSVCEAGTSTSSARRRGHANASTASRSLTAVGPLGSSASNMGSSSLPRDGASTNSSPGGSSNAENGSLMESNAGTSSHFISHVSSGSNTLGGGSGSGGVGGGGGGGGGRSRHHDATQTATLIAQLIDCLKELGSYRHIYVTLDKQEELTFNHVVEDVFGMLLALGVSENDIEW